MVNVYLVRLSDAIPLREALIDALLGPRKDKALRFLREEDQVRSALGSLLIRHYAGEGDVLLLPKEKPYIENGKPFNLSHAGDYVGIAISDEDVGLDIEDIQRCDVKIASVAFTLEEAKSVSDKESFAYAWTRKEAVAKCLGDGIWRPRESGLKLIENDKYEYEGKTYFVQSQKLTGHIVTVATKKKMPPFVLEIISASKLVK